MSISTSAYTLELDKILKMLADRCSLNKAKVIAAEIKPQTSLLKVNTLLAQTDEAYKLIAGYGSPSFGHSSDVKNSLARAENGGVLSMGELLEIAEVLRTIRALKEWRSRSENIEAKNLDEFFFALLPNKYFEDKIFTSIKSADEMDDNASAELKNIRRKIHSAELNIRDRLEKLVRSKEQAKFLQDGIITQRQGRFVVPVKAEHRAEIPGLLHDTSASGATLFVEPMAVVELNNEIRELLIKEKDEIERILTELSSEAGTFAFNINSSFDAVVELCVIFAKASLAFDMKACLPSVNDQGKIYLKNARHPLLDRKTVVPVTIPLGADYDTIIITGPNTGGKTVTIKTIGLFTLMAMCGLMLPVSDGSEISVFDNVLVDIGDEQSIEQSLSTFSSHMVRIVKILETSDQRSLVLIDELGAGTDPVEGAALATAILMKLRERQAKIAATTHYAELKSFALETDGVCNASCEFDVNTLKPTYKLMVGMPGRSNAFAISERLGLDKETVALAKNLVTDENSRFERVVKTLEQTVKAAENDRLESAKIRFELEALKKQQQLRNDELNLKCERALEKAREQATAIVERSRAEAERLLAELKAISNSSDSADERIRRARAELKSGVSKMLDAADPIAEQDTTVYKFKAPLKKGDKVMLVDLKKEAVVLADQTGDDVLVLAGVIKTRVPITNLRPAENTKTPPTKHRTVKASSKAENVRTASSEIDIRGMTGDEAELELDRFIDNSVMSGLSTVWIIHGKGTGALKKAVRSYLKTNKSVVGFRPGLYGEGEDGVTVVSLK